MVMTDYWSAVLLINVSRLAKPLEFRPLNFEAPAAKQATTKTLHREIRLNIDFVTPTDSIFILIDHYHAIELRDQLVAVQFVQDGWRKAVDILSLNP